MGIASVTVQGSPLESVMQGVLPAAAELYVESDNLPDILSRPRVAIVGSRRISAYGQAVTEKFASELASQGVVVVSGLAFGVDAAAHRAALSAGGLTAAVLPGGAGDIYPRSHRGLAEQILQCGGAIIYEHPPGTPAYKWNFIGRNRIVSGISHALLITEASVKSGTMHTARFALEQGKDVFAVPGNITSPTSEGTNNLIRSGASLAASPSDILEALGIRSAARKQPRSSDPAEQCILDLLGADVADGADVLERSGLPVERFNQTLTMLEITGRIRALGNNHWAVS